MSPDVVGDRYVLIEGVPRDGGLSLVRKAIDSKTGTPVAVKFVQGANDELLRRMFTIEQKTLKSLVHPNIVKLRDAGVDDSGTSFLVLDWVERNLNDLLGDPPWANWNELYRTFVRPLASAVRHIHLQRQEHRDIKPANILIDDQGNPILADFGIAKLKAEDPHSEHTVQNFRSGVYAPPEKDSTISYVRDVYGLAVVVLQCMTREKLVDLPGVSRALDAASLPDNVREFLGRCVEIDPRNRPANGIELATALEEFAKDDRAKASRKVHEVWLHITKSAGERILEGNPIGRSAEQVVETDLEGQSHLELESESGRLGEDVDAENFFLYGAEFRYRLRRDSAISGRFVVVSATRLPFEALEHGRRRSWLVPPLRWVTHQPANRARSTKSMGDLVLALHDFHERGSRPDGSDDLGGEDQLEIWARTLDARAEFARSEQPPMPFESPTAVGPKVTLTIGVEPTIALLGVELEILDGRSGYSFGAGEVIDHEGNNVVLLARRAWGALPAQGVVRIFDKPLTIALERQRTALAAINAGTIPNPDLGAILKNPSSVTDAKSVSPEVWFGDLDAAKRHAVGLALGDAPILAIEGPPGTGKTRLIAEVIQQCLRSNPDARILVASQTHVAVDNAIERLKGTTFASGIVRLAADSAAVAPAVHEFILEQQMPRWAAGVKERANAAMEALAISLGVEIRHARAALVLERLASRLTEIEAIESREREKVDQPNLESDFRTAVEDNDAFVSPIERLEGLQSRAAELRAEAATWLQGDLTMPENMSVAEVRIAIQAIVGDGKEAKELLRVLELQGEWLERIDTDRGLSALYLSGASVIAGTCIGLLRHKVISQLDFDLCIVDEASRATLTEALVPMSRAKKWILVGDTRQLPPSDEDLLGKPDILDAYRISRRDLEETLFQRLVDGLPETCQVMLDEQYRMVRPIGDMISELFYEGKLRSVRVDGLPGYDVLQGGYIAWLDTSGSGESRREQRSESGSYANREEARVAIKHLENLDSSVELGLIVCDDKEPLDVLLIAPYASQVEELARRVRATRFRHLKVQTLSVDAVQGREADLVVFSLTRSNVKNQIGFLGPQYWRRINVALSRARYGVSIVGDAEFIGKAGGALASVLEYVRKNPRDCGLRAAS